MQIPTSSISQSFLYGFSSYSQSFLGKFVEFHIILTKFEYNSTSRAYTIVRPELERSPQLTVANGTEGILRTPLFADKLITFPSI